MGDGVLRMGAKGESPAKARTSPPGAEPNNQDVFVWALYLLGGSDRDIDVEDIYLKSFELAPARLSWRTRPDLPDYKKTAKALQSVEASTHVGLVHRIGPYTRRLTAEGAAWVARFRPVFEQAYGGKTPVRPDAANEHERRRRALKANSQFVAWQAGQAFDRFELADAFECSAASPANVWRGRVDEARRSADVLSDEQLNNFVQAVDGYLSTTIGGYR